MHSTAAVLYPPSCVVQKEHLSRQHLSCRDGPASPSDRLYERSKVATRKARGSRECMLAKSETADRFPGQPFAVENCGYGLLAPTAVFRRRSGPGHRLDCRLVHSRQTCRVEGRTVWDEGRRRGL